MKIRYIINGVFLLVLYFLLFHNTKNWRMQPSSRNLSYLFSETVGPDSVIKALRKDTLLVTEIDMILQKIEADSLAGSMKGKALIYAVAKQAQQRIDEGHESYSMDRAIAYFEKNKIILELPKSDWQKFQDYFKDCLFKDLRCDHLLNRTISHTYFPVVLILAGIMFLAFAFLIIRPLVFKKISRIKLRQDETIDHTIPANSGNH
ncbi:MAG: hypothetical protein WBA74_12100 [Cyclobacteriaceae bacterium]